MKSIPTLIKKYLFSKLDTETILRLFDDKEIRNLYIDEIQEAITMYNTFLIKESNFPFSKSILHNALHLKAIYPTLLPTYKEILNKLDLNEKLQREVFSELSESDYFSEVYQIQIPQYLLINLLILFYRTSLLSLYPDLRIKGAQISSVIEEMAVIMAKEDKITALFQATKHWVLDWKGEGFSQELANIVSSLQK